MTRMGNGYAAIVHHVSVNTDASNVDLTAIQNATEILPNTKTYTLDLETLNARISSVPGVKNSAVRRLPNGNISVHTTMHNVLGIYAMGDGLYYPISDDGTIVNQPSAERTPGAILFRGEKPNNITKITTAVSALAADIDYLELIEKRRWNIHTTNGITILLPEDIITTTDEYEPNNSVAQLIKMNTNHQILSRDISIIDLRDPKRVLIQKK
ncbi:MAG: cell division protein FtsQ/DivIB [Proteobacteria bacterium]|nr:cell division protein FtsQ/DivIB [Candidatus Enterousia scatequi]